MNPSRIKATVAGLVVAALGAVPLGPAAGAQEPEDGSCPPSVDGPVEGWVCMQLLLNTPTSSPGDAQIGLWEGVANSDGLPAAAEGIVFSDASAEAKVRAWYQSELGREPAAEAVQHWAGVIQDARSELPFEYAVFGSGEYLSRFESPEAFVNDQYHYYFGREASRDEQAYWAGRFNTDDLSNEGITRAIATSTEAGDVRAQRLYDDWLRRAPDPGGLEYWASQAAQQGLYPSIVDISVSDEAFATLSQRGMCLAPEGSC